MNYFLFKRQNLAIAYCDNLAGQGIHNARSGLFLTAPRRVGKTTFLLNELIPEAHRREWLTIYVDLWANKSASPSLLIAEAIKAKLAQFEGKITKLAKSVKLEKINVMGALTLDFSKTGFPENITLADALRLLHELANKPIVLIIDEAQHALTTADGLNTMFSIKSARDQLNSALNLPTSLMLVFTGSNRDKLTHLVLKKDQPFFGSDVTSFPLLNQDYTNAFTEWVNKNLSANNQFTKDSMWEAFQLIGHRPEILSYMTGQIALNGEASHFGEALKESALVWHHQMWDEFENSFNALNALQKAILEVLISQNNTWVPFSEDAIKQYKKITQQKEIPTATIQTAIQYLREQNFIWQSGRGAYALEDESFAEWFRHYSIKTPTQTTLPIPAQSQTRGQVS